MHEQSAADSSVTRGPLFLYRELWRFTAGKRAMLLGSMALLVAAQVVLLLIPYISGKAINALQLQGGQALREAGWWLLAGLGVAAGSWLLHGPGRVLERNVALAVRKRLATSLVEKLLELPMSWHESNHSAATAHRVQQSTNALSGFAQSQFIYLNSAVRLVGPIVALWWIEPFVGAAAMLGFTIISVSVLSFDRAMIRLARRENDAERRYSAALVDTLSNTTSLFALRQARGVMAVLEKRLLTIFEPLKRSIVLNEAKWCTVDLSSKALSCLLVALFAWLATRRSTDAGTQTLMLGSVYMVWEYTLQASGVISAIASHFQSFARQSADFESADAIRNAVSMPTLRDSQRSKVRWDRLEIRDLTFHHAASRSGAPALDQVCLTLKRGKRYALVGSSGCGKSTLLRVLAGLYASERILLQADEGPIVVSPPEAARILRATSTLIPQDAEVFEGTLAENLSLCESVSGPPSPDRYMRALELARVTDFIEPSTTGLDVAVAERAANWSGGQRSRVALARGILAAEGSDLVLLDEPTASLDPVTESHVYANLFAAFADACIVSSIHRLHLLDRFDEVLLMRDGRLIAQGPVDALILLHPEFAELMAAHRRERSPAPPDTAAVA